MFNRLPPVTRGLLIANVAVFLLQWALGEAATAPFMLWPLGDAGAMSFLPWQLLSYGFMHGGFFHLFFNMLVLFMFGAPLEHVWGPRRFLQFWQDAAQIVVVDLAHVIHQFGSGHSREAGRAGFFGPLQHAIHFF